MYDYPQETAALMSEDAETIGPAYLEGHTYGYPKHHGNPRTNHFVIVRCGDSSHGPIALNSGHHYTDDVRADAVRLLAEHNREAHGLAGIDVTVRTI